MEILLTSTEIFDTKTEKWSTGPELPTALAFATAVSTPLGTFILGGQIVGGDPSSVTGQILKLSLGSNKFGEFEYWELLPYELAVPRRLPAAISLNINNFRDTIEKQDCTVDFVPLTPKTSYNTKPINISKYGSSSYNCFSLHRCAYVFCFVILLTLIQYRSNDNDSS